MIRKSQIIDSVFSLLSAMRVPALVSTFQPGDACILMFHGFTDQREQAGIGNTEGLHLHIEDFDAICARLASDYIVIPLPSLMHRLNSGEPLPDRSVILTFDDGYESNLSLAAPVLARHHLPATIFVATDFIENRNFQWWDRLEFALGHTPCKAAVVSPGDRAIRLDLRSVESRRAALLRLLPVMKALPQEILRQETARIEDALACSLDSTDLVPAIYRPLSWDQLRQLHQSGLMTIGAHTHTHRILGRCRLDTARQELETCRNLLFNELGIDHPLFSYPNGSRGDHNAQTRALLEELGFQCALLTEQGFAGPGSDLFQLRRFCAGNTAAQVDMTASGTLDLMRSLNRAVRSGFQRLEATLNS